MSRFGRQLGATSVLLLLVTTGWYGLAQDTGPAPTPNDGVYGEPTLPNFEETASEESGRDEVFARMQADRARRGGGPGRESKLNGIRELSRQQQLYPRQMPGQTPPKGVPSWRSIGPTRTQNQTFGKKPSLIDSGLIRTILPHPTDPDTVYVLTTGGGLWKTTTFTPKNPRWEAKTDALVSTSGGSMAFGRTPDTLHVGLGDPHYVFSAIAGAQPDMNITP